MPNASKHTNDASMQPHRQSSSVSTPGPKQAIKGAMPNSCPCTSSISSSIHSPPHSHLTNPPGQCCQRLQNWPCALAVLDPDSGKQLNYRQLLQHPKYKISWSRSAADEFGCLAQGVGNRVKGTNTIHFIHKRDVPCVCTIRTEKADPNHTSFVAGGDKCNYPYKVATPTAEMLVAKILHDHVHIQLLPNDPLIRPEYI
eukprot:CCRYP_011530-RA/>CCRYP_011530-RA protein AED:0.47 eAED:0.46 QI:0/0/0/1/0/0/2/0/198